MLVLSRRLREKIVFPTIGATVEVVDVKGDRVRLGIEAPPHVTILREELTQRNGVDIRAARPSSDSPDVSLKLERHEIRNQLNVVTLGVALAQRQLQAGRADQAMVTLQRINGGVQQFVERIDTSAAGSAPAVTQHPKALLVEDDRNECELLAGLLRMAGYEVATVYDGVDALRYLAGHEPPDVMLVDMMLPHCDGQTTIRQVRKNPQYDDLRIYAISGYTADQLGVDCRGVGVKCWFQKPINPEVILKELNLDHQSLAV